MCEDKLLLFFLPRRFTLFMFKKQAHFRSTMIAGLVGGFLDHIFKSRNLVFFVVSNWSVFADRFLEGDFFRRYIQKRSI